MASKGWTVDKEEGGKTSFSKVVFMRPPTVRIYQVALADFNMFSASNYLSTIFFSFAAALWTGNYTTWKNTGALLAAILVTISAIIFLGVSIWKHRAMIQECEEAPYGEPTRQKAPRKKG